MNKHGRFSLQLIIGGYVIYLAIDLVVNQLSGSGTMSNGFAYIASAVLGIGGVAVCLLAVKKHLKERKADMQRKKEQTENHGNE